MKNRMGNKEYALLFVISLVMFYTVLSVLNPGIPFVNNGPSVVGSAGGEAGSSACSGNIQLSFFPAAADMGTRESAIVSGIQNCNGKIVFVRQQVGGNYILRCSCIVATGNGCGCSFSIDNSMCNSNTFTAQIDMNGNGSYNDAGEVSYTNLNVNACAPV